MCCGGDFSATFQACTFTKCTLYAVHGATATLRQCVLGNGVPACAPTPTLHRCAHGGGVPVAVAHGAGTTVHLVTCTIQPCPNGVTAECGLTVTAVYCRFSGCYSSLIARGTGTALSCRGCRFSGLNLGRAVLAEGCRVLLRSCFMREFQQGVVAEGRRAAVELHGCDIMGGLCAVTSREGGRVLLRQTRLSVRMPGAGRPPSVPRSRARIVCMEGCKSGQSGGAVQLDRCTLSTPERHVLQSGVAVQCCSAASLVLCKVSCGGRGVSVSDRGRATTVSHCSVHSMHIAACAVQHSGCTLRVVGGRLQGKQCAAFAEEGGQLVMRDVAAGGTGSRAAAAACAVTDGTARLLRCVLQDAQRGVIMTRAAVHARDVTISGLVNDPSCRGESNLCSTGFRHNGGTLSVAGGSVSGCAVAASMSTEPEVSTPSAADFEGVTFEGNGVGIRVCNDANCAVTAVRCDFQGSDSAVAARRVLAGVLPEQAAVLAIRCQQPVLVQDCRFHGHQRDFFVDGCPLEISGCTFLGGHAEGANMQLTGGGTVRGCRFEGSPGGIVLRGSRERARHAEVLKVRGCVFGAAVVDGVSIIEGAEAAISACRFDGCKRAMLACRDTSLEVCDTNCTRADVGLEVCGASTVRAERLTLTNCKDAVSVRAEGLQGTAVALLGCVATGSMSGAVLAESGVQMLVSGCTLEDSGVGLAVAPGASVRVVDTIVAGCNIGAAIGMPEETLEVECGVCGQSGAAAMQSAWRALHAGQAAGACAHQGAGALATLEDVIISACITGLQASGAGRVSARRLDVRGASEAYSLMRIGGAHAFEECTASGGSKPSVVSQRMLGPEHQYTVVPEECIGIQYRDEPLQST